MKKYFYIIVSIIIVTAIVLFIFYFINKNSDTIKIQSGQEIIKINNIYKNPVKIFSDSDIEYKKTSDYIFDYHAKDQLFVITIINKNIQTARENAEKDFLTTLQINEAQACKLKVHLGVPFSVNQDAAGVNYGLSFCPNGKSF